MKEKKAATSPNEQLLKTGGFNRSCGSLDRWATTRKRRNSKQRSTTCSPQSKRDHIRKRSSARKRSQSCAKRRKLGPRLKTQDLKDACTRCRIDWVSQGFKRGRTRRAKAQIGRKQCCTLRESKKADIETRNIGIFTCMVVSECILMELAVATVVQMLLIRSGIEMNPGNVMLITSLSHNFFNPGPSDTSYFPFCSSGGQYFNSTRVTNTMTVAHKDFQSKGFIICFGCVLM